MRRSFDGLQALARHAMGKDPLDGSLYVFVNRRGTQVRVLYFDRSGCCVWSKRIESGRFISDWRRVHTQEMNWIALKLLRHRAQNTDEHRFVKCRRDGGVSAITSTHHH